MAYILGTHLKGAETVKLALTNIYGIGNKKAILICAQFGLSDTMLIRDLTNKQVDQISQFISLHYTIDSELRTIVMNDIKRFILIGSYRGFRHNDGLPVRGQRTHTNAKTCRKVSIKGFKR
jgi:small subunit ribosomal protein S13